ncbi:MAG: ABC transporter substrate-binding protein [Actinomycetota bacterium]|nr:ABC transporter substrate-binding protein [Actinomycetota bacterium]
MGGRRQSNAVRAGARTKLLRVAVAAGAAAAAVTAGIGASSAGAASRVDRVDRVHRTAATRTFVVADTSSVEKLDPDVVTNFLDFQALGLIYQQLVQYNAKLQLKPELATSWSYSDGNKVLTFQLRKGVRFDDGEPFNAADVVASIDRALTPKTADASASFLSSVKKVVATGTYAVEFELSHPDNSILTGLTSVNFSMLPEAGIKAGNLATEPDGTGPFEFSSWSPNNSFVVKRNPHYWGGKVTLASVKIETVPTEQSIASALEANTAQLGLLTTPQVVDGLPSGLTRHKVLGLAYRALMLQDEHGPLANVDNRRAISCAITRHQVLQDAVFGDGRPVGPVPIGAFASKPVSVVCPTQNLKKAKAYLKKAGDPHGFTFSAIASDAEDPTDSAQATVVQSELSQAGIKMNVQNLAGTAYVQDWLAGKFQAAFAENGANPSPYVMYGRYFGAGGNLAVPAGYHSSTLQKLLAKGDAASTTAQQKPIWKKLSATLTTQAVWVWLFSAYNYAVTTSGVHGFQFEPTTTTSLIGLRTTKLS